MSELLKQAFEIFTPPFKYDPRCQRIVDSGGNMILDVRGWGRVQKFEDGDKIQDAYGEYFADLINRDLKAQALKQPTPKEVEAPPLVEY